MTSAIGASLLVPMQAWDPALHLSKFESEDEKKYSTNAIVRNASSAIKQLSNNYQTTIKQLQKRSIYALCIQKNKIILVFLSRRKENAENAAFP